MRKPLWVWVDTAATCNLRCALCYTISMQSTSVMDLDLFARLVEKFRSSSTRIVKFHLNWRGEPASNPRLADMLALLDGLPWNVEWHTNGTLLHPKRAAAVVAANQGHSIYVSLDGGTAAAFERNRGAGTWHKALRGLEALLAARGDASGPRICIYQLDLGVPPEQYDPRFRALTKRVDRYLVMSPVDADGGSLHPSGEPHTVPSGPCFWLGNALAVDVTGQAWTCLLHRGTRLGSLMDESVDDLLDRASAMRQRVQRETRAAIPGCAGCHKKEGTAHQVGDASVDGYLAGSR